MLLQARSQDLEKGGGGYFERLRIVQTTLTRIFIVLESVLHGLFEFLGKLGDSKIFSAQNQVVSKKKKRSDETDFSAEIQSSNVFSAQNQVVSNKKKKGLHRN